MKILITYQYFSPAFKAGGPIQSIANIVRLLSGDGQLEMFIFCSDTDLDGTNLDVQKNKWVNFSSKVKVYYNSVSMDKSAVNELIESVNPDVVFINGLYSLPYTVYPLLSKHRSRKIVSARGMLHPGALSQKRLKKQLFITGFKLLGLNRKCEYHATTPDEVEYISDVLGAKRKIWMVPNLPNVLDYQQPVEKKPGSVKLVSVSLLSPMKNTLEVLKALSGCTEDIAYDIYGPVKDAQYWEKCLSVIETLPENIKVKYQGEVLPHLVPQVLKTYHFFIMPSKSENFGHALYEALSSGRPVVTSHATPWNGLDEANAGYNINPDADEIRGALSKACRLSNNEYSAMTLAAKEYVSSKYNVEKIKSEYLKMFLSDKNQLN